jgi:hypothetical protein
MEVSIENTGNGYPTPRMAIIRKMESVALYNEARKAPRHKKKKNRKMNGEEDRNPFKDWCMPAQPTRYLRGSDHDFF